VDNCRGIGGIEMLNCKSYLHAVYLLEYNKVYIKYYSEERELKEGIFYLDKERHKNLNDGKFDGVIYVKGENNQEINYFTIVHFEVIEAFKLPEVKKTQAKLKEESMDLMLDKVGINRNIRMTMAELSDLLHSGVIEIEFIKVDGSLRKMIGTINDWRIGEDPNKDYFMGVDKDKERYGNIVVYDLEKHEYRTIRYLSIISVKRVT